jgi:hypothetical protein
MDAINTSNLAAWYPRNFVAPDGRIFGYDYNGKMYYVTTSGAGTLALKVSSRVPWARTRAPPCFVLARSCNSVAAQMARA